MKRMALLLGALVTTLPAGGCGCCNWCFRQPQPVAVAPACPPPCPPPAPACPPPCDPCTTAPVTYNPAPVAPYTPPPQW